MSTYNGEAFLQPQLDSLRAQHGVHVHLYVRDDGSEDRTLPMLRAMGASWPELTIIEGENLGAAASFLQLLKTVPPSSDFYAFCDQDDIWLPNKLSRAVDRLLGVPRTHSALYCSRVTCVDQDGLVIGQPWSDPDTRFEHLLFENIACGCTVVLNEAARSFITARMPTNGVVMHDWWCALVISSFGSILWDDESCVLYRQHGRNSIGVETQRFSEILKHVRTFFKDPTRFYQIHGQAAEFLRLYGDELGQKPLNFLQELVASRRSITTRLRYGISGPVVRSRTLDSLVVRALIVAGRY